MAERYACIDSDNAALPLIAPTTGRLIRLGQGQSWAKRSIDTGTMRFGDLTEPHDLCFEGDWGAVKMSLLRSGRRKGRASELTGQLRDFYTLGTDTLWITRVGEHLWWGFAEPDVVDLRGSDKEMGAVARRIRGGWRKHSIRGAELRIAELGPEFKVLRSKPAICDVGELAAFCRLINNQ